MYSVLLRWLQRRGRVPKWRGRPTKLREMALGSLLGAGRWAAKVVRPDGLTVRVAHHVPPWGSRRTGLNIGPTLCLYLAAPHVPNSSRPSPFFPFDNPPFAFDIFGMVATNSTMLPLGTKAPVFRLPDTGGKTVSLADFK